MFFFWSPWRYKNNDSGENLLILMPGIDELNKKKASRPKILSLWGFDTHNEIQNSFFKESLTNQYF